MQTEKIDAWKKAPDSNRKESRKSHISFLLLCIMISWTMPGTLSCVCICVHVYICVYMYIPTHFLFLFFFFISSLWLRGLYLQYLFNFLKSFMADAASSRFSHQKDERLDCITVPSTFVCMWILMMLHPQTTTVNLSMQL